MEKEYLEIVKNGEVRQKIDIEKIKKTLKDFQELQEASKAGEEFVIRRVTHGAVVEENVVNKTEKLPENNDYINEILDGCTGNLDFYKGYLQGVNYLRIMDDFQFIKPYLQGNMKILEIGSVPPFLDLLMYKEGVRDLTILDPNASEFITFWNKCGIKYIEGDITDIKKYLKNESYDMIILSEVWEHLLINMYGVVEDLHSLLKQDGLLFLTTPNLASISGVYGLLCASSGYATKYSEGIVKQYIRYNKMGYYGHLREYTPREMEQLFVNTYHFEMVNKKFIEQRNGGIIDTLETMFPEYASMGKYLFKKHIPFYTTLVEKEVCIWGAGQSFVWNFSELKRCLDIKYIVDSDAKNKEEEYKGIPCVSPEILDSLREPFVVITLDKEEYRIAVSDYLTQKNIPYAFYDEIEIVV